MTYDEIVKFLNHSVLGAPDKFISLLRFYYAGFLTSDAFLLALTTLGLTSFTGEGHLEIAKMMTQQIDSLKMPGESETVFDSGRRRYILPFEFVRSVTLDGRASHVWAVKDSPDIAKITAPSKKEVAVKATILEEHGLLMIEDKFLVSRTVQPVWCEHTGTLLGPAVMVFPIQSEEDLLRNVPIIRAFGGGVVLAAMFEAFVIPDSFKQRFGCPAEIALICRGYLSDFNQMDNTWTPVDSQALVQGFNASH